MIMRHTPQPSLTAGRSSTMSTDEDPQHELWLEKRGVGFPHYKLVKRRKETEGEKQAILVAAILFVLLLWAGVPMGWLVAGFVVVVILIAWLA